MKNHWKILLVIKGMPISKKNIQNTTKANQVLHWTRNCKIRCNDVTTGLVRKFKFKGISKFYFLSPKAQSVTSIFDLIQFEYDNDTILSEMDHKKSHKTRTLDMNPIDHVTYPNNT